MRLTKNFTTEELRCPCNCGFGDSFDDYAPELLMRLQQYRDFMNGPVRPTSGARCPTYNASIGGARNSAHLPLADPTHRDQGKCRAVDVECIGSRTRYYSGQAARDAGFTRIGSGMNFKHFDVAYGDPYAQEVEWMYDPAKDHKRPS